MPEEEEEDGLLDILKFVHKIFIDIIKLLISSLEPVRKLWLL